MENGLNVKQLENWIEAVEQKIRSKEETMRPLRQELVNLQKQREALRVLYAANVAASRPSSGPSPAGSPGQQTAPSRTPNGDHTQKAAFRQPILDALVSLGGRSDSERVIDMVRGKMTTQFKPGDLEVLPSGGEQRWRNTLRWARKDLVDRGDLRSDSPRGYWELSDEAWDRLYRQTRS